ncbi:MAG: PspA/IM30 family protein [Halieaceae bacterium]
MTIFNKLNTLLRANVRESVEQLTDANAIRIYRQEIVDAEMLLAQRRDTLAVTIATRKELEQEVDTLTRRIGKREQQVSRLPETDRSEDLLKLAAMEIATSETQLAASRRRHFEVCEQIQREESTLRKLLSEIRQHRRDIKLLEAQLSRQRGQLRLAPGQTISGRLAALQATRASISSSVSGGEYSEAGMTEALERVETSPLDRELSTIGGDDSSLHIAQVLDRLKTKVATT